MKFIGIYFTGTGNTKRVADTVKSNLVILKHDIDLIDVITVDTIDLSLYDGLFVFYPIYGFNAPKPIIDFVKRIKKLDKQLPCVIMKQSGEHLFWNNASSLYLIKLLKRRNIKVTNEYHYLMPYSFIFRHSDYMAYKMDTVMKGLVPLDLEDFLSGKEVRIKRFFLDRFFAWVLRIQWWGGRINGKHYKIDKNKCVNCMTCVNNCPSKNIAYNDGEFKFQNKCLMCQRCIMYCPAHAIKGALFDSWRVDVPYSFKEAEYQEEVRPKYCKKSYDKYFTTSLERTNKSKQ
jgi:NAD-dependent dihydropyrimidine dehydrogenase PreA subunit